MDPETFVGEHGSLFVGGGFTIATRGVAARVPRTGAIDFLATLSVDDEVNQMGSGPLLLGAIPFDSSESHDFVLPEEILVHTASGECWFTSMNDKAMVQDASRPSPGDERPPGDERCFTTRTGVDVERYLEAVRRGRDEVRSGNLTKVVIARDVFIDSDQPIDLDLVLARLRDRYPQSYRFCLEGLVGASPELLVSRMGHAITSHPLAGTTARTGDPELDARLATELRRSAKNQIEHRVVIDMVHDTLLPYCSFLDWEPEPDVIEVGNVQHLGTRLFGHLSDPPLHVLEAAYALSPTPALGGHPREAAVDLIKKVEGFERSRYGGAIGWFDRSGNGIFAVTIRCAEVSADRRSAHLFAGGGIVADSEPTAELAETEAKLQAMTKAITGS
ncbi:MAG: isochorismate synthase MenF [Ilumatobacteraceae bacterium]